jgi:hypothetical protein
MASKLSGMTGGHHMKTYYLNYYNYWRRVAFAIAFLVLLFRLSRGGDAWQPVLVPMAEIKKARKG